VSVLLALALSAAGAPPAKSEALALQAIHNFGACVVETTPKGAEEMLAMDYTTKAYDERLRALARGHGRCVLRDWRIQSSRILLAGALAEGLLNSEVKPADLAQTLAYDPSRPPIPARSETETMALCTVMQSPQATAELLQTEPASKEEHQAMTRIVATLPNCLKKDANLTLNPPALRSLLALAAWQIVGTPKVATQ
jgi:hypothetical protein